MNEMITHAGHLVRFDGILHWCFLISVFGLLFGVLWTFVRVLMPLRRLATQAASIMEGNLPAFDTSVGGIREIEQLRRSLQGMVIQIKSAQEREIAYRNALTDSQENERMRIAHDIHDDTIQSLIVVAHNMERAAVATETHHDNPVTHLKNARHQLIIAIDGLRQLIANLRSTVLDELGLVSALEMLCEQHPKLAFLVQGEVYPLARAQELALFRAAQEAIHNAERHAHPDAILVRITYAEGTVMLEVRDDGTGFQIPQHLQDFARHGHYGLMGIRERITHLGGQLHLISEQSVGTRLMVTLPTAQTVWVAA